MFKFLSKKTTQTEIEGLRQEVAIAMNQAISDKGDGIAILRAINAELERLMGKTNITIADIDSVIRKVGHGTV